MLMRKLANFFTFKKKEKYPPIDNFVPSWIFAKSKSTSFSCFERLNSHMGAEKHPTVGSSGEYWSLNESLNQRFAEMTDS